MWLPFGSDVKYTLAQLRAATAVVVIYDDAMYMQSPAKAVPDAGVIQYRCGLLREWSLLRQKKQR